MTNTLKNLENARRLAVQQNRGRVLTPAERVLIAYWVDRLSPENFYMDGEIFADQYA